MNPSPLRVFGAFVLSLLLAMLAAAVISPPLQWLLQALLGAQPGLALHKIFNRVVQLLVLALMAVILVRAGLAHRRLLGYERPWQLFLRRLGVGLTLGVGLMAAVVLPLFPLGLREWSPARLPEGFFRMASFLVDSVRIGLVIAVVEETLFRGAMQGALERTGARRFALFGVPALYAAVHFFGDAIRIPDAQVNWLSGFTVVSGYFALFRNPLRIWDAFLCLYFVGLLLALVRHRTGGIATCIGLHAGFVAVITALRRASERTGIADSSLAIGSFDGLLGLWVAVVAALACLIVAKLPRRQPA